MSIDYFVHCYFVTFINYIRMKMSTFIFKKVHFLKALSDSYWVRWKNYYILISKDSWNAMYFELLVMLKYKA